MNKFRFAVLLLVVAVPSGECQQTTLTVDEIADRHIQALGGIDNIRSVHSLVIRGIYHEPGEIPSDASVLEPHAYQAFLRPYYEVIGDPEVAHPEIREGFDGSAWEYYGNPGVVLRTVGAAAAATRHASEFLQDSIVDFKEKGTKIELGGMEKIGDLNTYRLQVTLADGFQKLVFVDERSFLIAAERKSAPIHAFGKAVATETRFSDYRPETGVMMYHRALEVEIATGKVLNEFRRVVVEINSLNDPSIFSPSPYPHTPLQQFLEQLYMERTDSVSVTYSYRVFREAHPELDTREGVEFIGYQIVKMGDFKAGIELLHANANDYPHSASAQYELGRAYKAAGNPVLARKSFQRALQIDPTFHKARDAMKSGR